MTILRPAHVCSNLLGALEASEGRRRQRKRDQTPDAIGLAAKREVLERAVDEDPEPDAFEAWLLRYAHEHRQAAPMALAVLEEWRLARVLPGFREWLEAGAPSEDAGSIGSPRGRDQRRP
jgi:hypothetical protein